MCHQVRKSRENYRHRNAEFILADSNIPYQAVKRLPASGQRDVYLADGLQDGNQYIVKVAHYSTYNIGRVQREIKILNDIKFSYFPTIILDTFVADSILVQYYDNLFTAQKSLGEEHVELVEKLIPWDTFMASTDEIMKCEFIEHCFKGLDLLWDKKIVHRDLKPDNILI